MAPVASVAGPGLAAADPCSIGPYRVVRRLGQGGMGIVYLAVGPDGRTVAVKAVRPEIADQHQFRTRFAREVHAARAVGGQYTARLVDADTDATPQWTATEYVPGPTLAEHIEAHGAMPEDQVRLLGLGLAEAVAAIHAAGHIHRDLKPSNVILSAEGPKVIDFGISQAADATSLTHTGSQVGSLAWMPPEQVTGEPVTPATDMFALGLILAYAATGTHPYGQGRPEALAFRMVNQTADLALVPLPLQDLCRQLLATDPGSRPAPATVITALGGDAAHLSDITRVIGARWDATIAMTVPGTPPATVHVATGTAPPGKRRRGRALAATALGLVAASVALGGVLLSVSASGGSASPDTAVSTAPLASEDPWDQVWAELDALGCDPGEGFNPDSGVPDFCYEPQAPAASSATPAITASYDVCLQSEFPAAGGEFLRRGDGSIGGTDAESQMIRSAQEALGFLGYGGSAPITADGSLGSDTQAALRSFQQDMGRYADGVLGPRTWTTLHDQVTRYGMCSSAQGSPGTVEQAVHWWYADQGLIYVGPCADSDLAPQGALCSGFSESRGTDVVVEIGEVRSEFHTKLVLQQDANGWRVVEETAVDPYAWE